MKQTTTTSPRRKRASAPLADAAPLTDAASSPVAPPAAAVSIGDIRWTILPTAEASLAKALEISPEEASKGVVELVAELRATPTRAQQQGWEIWRASSRWHRLRVLVERVNATEHTLHDVLPHADWTPPAVRPAPKPVVAAPPPAPLPLKMIAPPPEAPVLVVRRAAPRASASDAATPEPSATTPSVASVLSTSQLLALHAVLADWRRGGIWPGLTKIAATTELPRSQASALANELEQLKLTEPTSPILAAVKARLLRAAQAALKSIPIANRPEPRAVVDLMSERICVVTLTADFDVVDFLVEAVAALKGEGMLRLPRGVRAVIRV